MKKVIFSMLALGGLLTACSSDDVINNAPQAPNDAIGFNTIVNKPGRGVSDITSPGTGDNPLTAFQVWGYEKSTTGTEGVVTRFNGTNVTYASSEWTYSPVQYWTVGNTYWFAGYHAGASNVATFVPGGTTVWPADAATPATTPLFGGTMYFNNGADSWTVGGTTLSGAQGDDDLVYAWWKTNGAITTGTKPTVDFAFKHILSKVAFKFVNNLPHSSIKITNLVVKSVPTQGTLDMSVATPAWSATGTFDMNYASDIAALNNIAPNGGSATSAFNIFIPAAFTYYIDFTVEVWQGSVLMASYNHTVNVSSLNLEIGNAYVLTATLDTNNIDPNGALVPISFNPTVEDWNYDVNDSGAVDADDEVPVNVPAE